MNINYYFNENINDFINHIKLDIPSINNYNIIIGSNRCMGRVRDYKTYNVNKRCRFMALPDSNLCKKCNNRCPNGLINENLDENSALYKTYKKKNSNFINEYDLNVKLFCPYTEEDFIIHMRNIQKHISKTNHIMQNSCDIEDIYNNLSDYIDINSFTNINTDDPTLLHNTINFYKKDIVAKMKLHLTIAETEELYDKIHDFIINNSNKKSINELIANADIITLRELNHEVDLYLLNNDDKHNPYSVYMNSKSGYLLIGYARNWVDHNGDVPDDHKNHEGLVLDADTQLPILEVEINETGSLLTGIQKGIYREWEYDDEVEQFRKTSYIERM